MNFLLISRDSRTDKLFRSSWKQLLDLSGHRHSTFYLGIGMLEKLKNVYRLRQKQNNFSKIVVFGLMESISVRILLPGNHFYVFTGLGRSWLHSFSRIIVILTFYILFRRQRIAVLNNDDYSVLQKCGCDNIVRLHGEGHPLLNKFPKANIEPEQTSYDLHFLYVGRLLKSKGVIDVLDLLAEYSNVGLKLQFTCIGDQDFNNSDSISLDELEKYRSKFVNFNIVGFKREPWISVPSDAIYISASRREGFSFSVLEALYRGHFCLLSRVPGHKDFFGMQGVASLEDVQQPSSLIKVIAEWNKRAQRDKLSLRFEDIKCYSAEATMDEKKEFLKIL